MGQAKLRGTKEQRVEQAKARRVGVPVNVTTRLQKNGNLKRGFAGLLLSRLTTLFHA